MLGAFPNARTMLANKGYDTDWFRDALAKRKITAFEVIEAKGSLSAASRVKKHCTEKNSACS